MKSFRTLGATLCVLASAAAQVLAAPADSPRKYVFKDEAGLKVELMFPFVTGVDDVVATRINAFLHLHDLRIAPPLPSQVSIAAPDSPDSLVTDFSGMGSKGVTSVDDGRVLSVSYWAQLRGDAAEVLTTWQFDSRSGRAIWTDEIFSQDGLQTLADRVENGRAAEVRNGLAKAAKGSKDASVSLYRELGDIYKEWLGKCFRNGKPLRGRGPGNVIITDTGISVKAVSCGTEIDSHDVYSVKFSKDEIAPLLSAYGRYLIQGEGDGASPNDRISGQVLRGSIDNRFAVVMYFDDSVTPGTLKGFYYYEKYRKGISLTGKKTGPASYELREGEATTAQPVFSLQNRGGKLSGIWSNGTKSFGVSLEN